MDFPTVDACQEALRRAGWSVGERYVAAYPRGYWLVDGANGENQVAVTGGTQLQAWQLACDEADALGMLGRPRLLGGAT